MPWHDDRPASPSSTPQPSQPTGLPSAHRLLWPNASSARVMLATNQPITGRKNENFLVQAVRGDAPKVQHPLRARFDDRIEFGVSQSLAERGAEGDLRSDACRVTA